MAGLIFFDRMIEQPIGHSVPQGNVYEGRLGRAEIGRVSGRAEAGPAVQGKFAGGQGFFQLSQGFLATANAREAEVFEKQKLDALAQVTALQDEERGMLQQMETLTGSLGDQAPALAEGFYKKAEEKLMGKATGDFQRGIYTNALSRMRDQGLNKAADFQLRQREVYRTQVFQGLQSQLDQQIAANPTNYQNYTGQKIENLAIMNPNAAPEWLAAQGNVIAAEDYALAFESTLANGNLEAAGAIMRQAFEASPATVHSRLASPYKLPKGAEPWLGLVDEAARTYGVPANVILGVMQTESAFLPGAVSPTKVKGLMQVTGETYKALGFTGDRADPRNSVMAGTKLLGQLYQKYGNWEDAFADYNGGPDAVRGLKTGNWGRWANDPAKQREIRGYGPATMRNVKAMGDMVIKDGPIAAGEDAPVQLASLGGLMPGMGAAAADSDGDQLPTPMPSGYGGLVPPKQLMAMQTSYIKAVNDRAKAEEAKLKRQGDEVQKNMTIKWYSPEGISQDDVISARDYLSPDNFDKYMARARDGVPPPSHSDRNLLIEAREMAGDRATDFQATIDEGLKAYRLTVADYNTLASLGEKSRPPAYKQSEQIIRLKTGRSEMNPNPAADLSYLQAMGDFDAWLDSDAGRQASDRDRVEMANRIGDNYRLINLENNLLGVPAPLFLVGNRTAPNIEATARATKAAFEGGQMSEEQFNEECIRIKRMADILRQQQIDADASRANRSSR